MVENYRTALLWQLMRDCPIILVLLLANAVVGFWEEREAGNATEAPKPSWRSRHGSNVMAGAGRWAEWRQIG